MQAVIPLQYGLAVRRRPSQAVYRRRRIAVLLCVAALVALGWLGVQRLTGNPGNGPLTVAGQPVSHINPALVGSTRVIVQPGDTLWSIARRVQPTGDLRPLVDKLSAQRHGAALQVGETFDLSGLR